jgi:hypothetical protein
MRRRRKGKRRRRRKRRRRSALLQQLALGFEEKGHGRVSWGLFHIFITRTRRGETCSLVSLSAVALF